MLVDRTQFQHQDNLVPWKLKGGGEEEEKVCIHFQSSLIFLSRRCYFDTTMYLKKGSWSSWWKRWRSWWWWRATTIRETGAQSWKESSHMCCLCILSTCVRCCFVADFYIMATPLPSLPPELLHLHLLPLLSPRDLLATALSCHSLWEKVRL